MYLNKIFVSENQQIKYLIKIIAVFLFVTKVWSYKTWIAERVYPVIPPFDFLKSVPDSVHLILLVVSLLSLLLIIFLKANRSLLSSLFIFELLSCSLDTVLWQPWEFMYLCMLLVVLINFSKPKNIVFLFHLLLIAMYLYSGLHKFNRNFLALFWRDSVLQDFFGLSMELILKYKLFFVGLLIPIIEVSLAILLLVSKSKRKISYLLIGMHFIILVLLGPLGLKYNSIVWSWNLALIMILYIIYQKPVIPLRKDVLLTNFYWLVLWFVMPVFSFFGNYYQYFSFNLYSAKGYQMYICIENDNNELKTFAEPVDNKLCKDKPYLILQNWAMYELKSAPSPEIEVYEKMSGELKKKYGSKNIRIFLYTNQTMKTEEL